MKRILYKCSVEISEIVPDDGEILSLEFIDSEVHDDLESGFDNDTVTITNSSLEVYPVSEVMPDDVSDLMPEGDKEE